MDIKERHRHLDKERLAYNENKPKGEDRRYYEYYLNLAYKVIDEKKVTIADLQKENEALKATIAREKVASIELDASEWDDIIADLQKKQDN